MNMKLYKKALPVTVEGRSIKNQLELLLALTPTLVVSDLTIHWIKVGT